MRNTWLTIAGMLLCFASANADPARLNAIRSEAEKGDPGAQNKLGVYYQLGLSVEQSDADAVKWFRMAAEQDDGEAQFNLGEMYESGRGVPVNRRVALSWYGKSCDNGCKCGCRSFRRLNRELEREQNLLRNDDNP
jgi:TPR repeat protein